MNLPDELKYTASHEWIRLEDDGTVSIGITDHAQAALGDVVFLELPTVGRQVDAGEACAVVESVKAASDIYSPLTGQVQAINDGVSNAPEQLNQNGYFALNPPISATLTTCCRQKITLTSLALKYISPH